MQALGGENFLNMEDRIETGRAYSFYRDQISGLSIANIYTRYITVAPEKTGEDLGQREREAFGKNEDSAVLFTENGGWEINWRGSKELPKDRSTGIATPLSATSSTFCACGCTSRE